ncbi:hypothetical protein ACFX2C_028910 [Malus domestica]
MVSPRIPLSGSGDKHHRRLGLGLGIAGPAFFLRGAVGFRVCFRDEMDGGEKTEELQSRGCGKSERV